MITLVGIAIGVVSIALYAFHRGVGGATLFGSLALAAFAMLLLALASAGEWFFVAAFVSLVAIQGAVLEQRPRLTRRARRAFGITALISLLAVLVLGFFRFSEGQG